MADFKDLYRKDLILTSQANSKEAVLEEVAAILEDKDLVTSDFASEIVKRESSYPTGLDLSVVNPDSPNVAIPHTEADYCKGQAIVYVKLDQEVTFHNMIKPEEDLAVKYLFMIINNQGGDQTTVLSDLMAFFTQPGNIDRLEELEDAEAVYQFLSGNN